MSKDKTNIKDMSNQLISELVHVYVLSQELEVCRQSLWSDVGDGLLQCRGCERVGTATALQDWHIKPLYYADDWNKAHQIVQRMEEQDMEELHVTFACHLGVTYATLDGFDTFEMNLRQWAEMTPRKICEASLRTATWLFDIYGNWIEENAKRSKI